MPVHPLRRRPTPVLPRALATVLLAAALVPGAASAQAPATPPKTPPKSPSPIAKRSFDDARKQRVVFNPDFDKADIVEVIKMISQWTGKNFILPENVRGKITIISPTAVTADEAYAMFIAALEANNLQVTPTGRFLKIVPKKESIRSPIPTYLDPSAPIPLDERMITKLLRLKYSEADPIKNVLQQFITREGEIVPFVPDVLIISDNALNLARLERLVEQLDQPGSQDEIHVLQIENASAQELSAMLLQIFQQQGQATGPGRRPTAVPTLAREPGKAPPGQAGSTEGSGGGGTISKIIPDERTNKLIIIGPARVFERVRSLARKLDVPTDGGQVQVYYLENADAEELSGTLQALASGQTAGAGSPRRRGATPAATPPGGAAGGGTAALFAGEVKVTADKATNSLLVIASPSDYRNLVKVIERLDVRRRQVFIEAVIMEVKLNGDNRFGIDLHTGYAFEDVEINGQDETIPLIVGSQVSSAGASLNLARLASLTGFLAGIQGPPIAIPGLPISLPSFGVILNALQKNSDVNVISTPHILTSDNEEAEIKVGSNVPFQAAFSPGLGGLGGLGAGLGGSTGTGLGAASGLGLGLGGLGSLFAPIQRQPVELALKIKPQVNESDFVKLEIDEQIEEISSVDPQLGPTTAKRSIKTVVVAKDQTTVVIGGLIQDRITRSESKVPILGSLPIVGALFRSTTQIKEKTNLLLFLTPYIIKDQQDFRRIFERKMKERQEFVARFFGSSEQYAAYVDFERKKGPLAALRASVAEERLRTETGAGRGEQAITPDDEAIELPSGTVAPGDSGANGDADANGGAEPAPQDGGPPPDDLPSSDPMPDEPLPSPE